MRLFSARKAEMGVGTLIIFIAMLIVAAVAAGVLIQTAGSLQQQALSTGQATRSEISTNARVVEASGVDGQDGTVENFTMQIKLSPGSEPIKLDEVTVTLNLNDQSTTYLYRSPDNSSVYCSIGGNNYTNAEDCATVSGTTGNFTVEYLINGTNHIDGNLQRGDLIYLYISSPRTITEDEAVRITFIPKSGTTSLVEFNTPDVISTERVYLYP